VIQAPEKTARTRRTELQALLTVVPCAHGHGLSGLRVSGERHTSECFLPFSVSPDAPRRAYGYAGFVTALDRLRTFKADRILILTDDDQLVAELERRADPPKELTLEYIIAGCKLNEMRHARLAVAPASRLEDLRAKATALAATMYPGLLPAAS
jgi:hypothetical protein